jgi:hypothetical protein
MLYTLNGAYPGELPNRIRLSTGATRTDSSTFTADEIQDAGYFEVAPAPEYDPHIQVLEWGNANSWYVRDKTDQELLTQTDNQWNIIRAKRNQLLQESDWTQMLDVVAYASFDFKDNWRVYRQALRDITLQSDPFNITWPVKP